MIVFTSRDNHFTRFVERNAWRLAGATVCRVIGHRHSRYIWGACGRCCQFYRRPTIRVPADGKTRRVVLAWGPGAQRVGEWHPATRWMNLAEQEPGNE